MPLDNKYVITTSKLTAIGDAIRAKTGSSASMTLDEMVTAIGNISGGGGSSMESGTFTGDNRKTVSLSLQSQPSHVMFYSPFADFGTDTVWNCILFVWNAGEAYYNISFYGSSNVSVDRKAETNVQYANGTLTISKLNYATRIGKTYNWYAW